MNPAESDDASPREPSPIDLPPDAMREFGYRVIDLIVEHFATGHAERVTNILPTREAADRLFREPLPEKGMAPEELLAKLERDLLPNVTRVDHPRFFGYVPGPGHYAGVMAETLAAGFNIFAGTWVGGSAAAAVELVTIDWLKDMCSFPAEAGGLFVSGGSAANLTALAVARQDRLGDETVGAIVYFSDQTHHSLDRALKILGFPADQRRRIPTDDQFRLPIESLARQIGEDRAAGLRPFCVIANVGTTNTGAVDLLGELADLCEREGLWLHGDGAYGAAAVMTERGRARLKGIDRLDSLSIDPHKWFFQPFETGCVIVRDARLLPTTFRHEADYMGDLERIATGQVHFAEWGMQLTRSFRALKLWMAFKLCGAEAFREAIDSGFDRAEQAEALVRDLPDWRIVSPARLGMVTFRYEPTSGQVKLLNEVNLKIVDELTKSGYAFLSTTTIDGRATMRLCPINPRTTKQDIQGTIERLDEIARQIAAET